MSELCLLYIERENKLYLLLFISLRFFHPQIVSIKYKIALKGNSLYGGFGVSSLNNIHGGVKFQVRSCYLD